MTGETTGEITGTLSFCTYSLLFSSSSIPSFIPLAYPSHLTHAPPACTASTPGPPPWLFSLLTCRQVSQVRRQEKDRRPALGGGMQVRTPPRKVPPFPFPLFDPFLLALRKTQNVHSARAREQVMINQHHFDLLLLLLLLLFLLRRLDRSALLILPSRWSYLC